MAPHYIILRENTTCSLELHFGTRRAIYVEDYPFLKGVVSATKESGVYNINIRSLLSEPSPSLIEYVNCFADYGYKMVCQSETGKNYARKLCVTMVKE